MNPGSKITFIAQHSLDLLSESLVYEGVHKRIYCRVEHDHYGSTGMRHIAVWDADKVQDVHTGVCKPTDSKNDTDNYGHQGDSLSHLKSSLHIERDT